MDEGVVRANAERELYTHLPPADVRPGDVVLIPRDTPQRISNTGDHDLVFLCLCTPPFTPDCYEGLE